jgi:glycosyltransferase involved in cell wall biosynthesis
VHLVVEAAARADVELDVVGEGEERARLEALARRLGARAHFAGLQADPRPFVSASDVVVTASDNEPLGLAVLEALAMGRPVIAYRGGGVPEIVVHGETGWLVGEATPEAFARALCLARGERLRLAAMGEAARRFAVEHGAVERMCAGYATVYEALRRRP